MPKNNNNLIFLGTIISVENSPLENSILSWVITANVDEVVLGGFSGKTIRFRIHSPSQSGIEEKKQYVIEAALTKKGYIVDELQWQKEKQKLPKKPDEQELKEIGLAIISSIEKWLDEPAFHLKNTIKFSQYTSFSKEHYIADWYLDEDGYTLYCIRLPSEYLRLKFYIELRKIASQWRAMSPVIEKTWRKK